MTLTLGYLVNVILAAQNGIGLPMSTLTMQNMVNFLKIVLAIEVMYYVNVFCIKVSILFTYIRFGTIVLHVVFVLVCIFTTLGQCQPIHKFWDITGTVKGTCINTTAFFYCENSSAPFPLPILTPPTVTSSFNIVTDIWILLLPISTLREIHRPPREKVALFLIFGVGTFATIASIVRLHTIYTYTLATDPFHEGTKVNLWSVIEVTIAISCASVSALKPMFSRRQRRLTLGAIGGRSGGHGYRAYGTGTFTGTNNTGNGTGAGSRSTGTWALAKNKGINNGLGTQSSEIGLHDEDMEDIELQRLGSHAETLVDDQATEITSHHQQQQRQHPTIAPPPPSPPIQIQRPKPAAITLNNQTRPFSFPPPLSPNQIAGHMGLKYPGYQGPASQQQQQQQQQQYGGGGASTRGRERGMSETASTTSTSRQMTMMGGVQSQGQGQGLDGGTWAGLQGEVVSTGTGPRDGTPTRPPIGPRASTFGE
ncbi:hypothetical protein NEUTE1DRAFT_98643 [Neurospora tetrasperma FGSC 2508]|uniref:Rhodopsin domain-containing protein n=1 Tax=Neurospora tetrasperma (strain FGSC 2508 / ATCC MYA-4615 / P0657) TaxID=510951 RepID=F8ME09_NEUT8|nr:uncharacterized protein NEUTE1DRAFT_98643 [Neurospora tetrasperma FGSC 2508]EGO61544.1 hypothetical protein NEUTE1DRAFT_98643 [Neurospora tetrasperma FGSC 2508]